MSARPVKLDAAALNALQENGSLTLDGVVFSSEDILIYREPREGTQALSNRFISIDLDCTLDAALVREGLAREVVSRIQKTRKDLGLKVTDRIRVQYRAGPELADAIAEHATYIANETLATTLEASTAQGAFSFDVDEYSLELTISVAA